MAEKTMFDIIKKQNGERFAKAIRAYDNGIFDIKDIDKIVKYAGRDAEPILQYLVSLKNIQIAEQAVHMDPIELLSRAGYDAYVADTLEKQNAIKKYYAPGEELCTFRDPHRFERYHIINAVRKDVDQIRREDFPAPEREDKYGTSVISIQVLKTGGFISIKNRYNHTVPNPDNTLNSNPDNIITGLSDAIKHHFGVDFSAQQVRLPNHYTIINDQIIRFDTERNNVYCAEDFYAKDGVIYEINKDSQIMLGDGLMLDLRNKEVRDITRNPGNIPAPIEVRDVFIKSINDELAGKKLQLTKNPLGGRDIVADGHVIFTVENGDLVNINLPNAKTIDLSGRKNLRGNLNLGGATDIYLGGADLTAVTGMTLPTQFSAFNGSDTKFPAIDLDFSGVTNSLILERSDLSKSTSIKMPKNIDSVDLSDAKLPAIDLNLSGVKIHASLDRCKMQNAKSIIFPSCNIMSINEAKLPAAVLDFSGIKQELDLGWTDLEYAKGIIMPKEAYRITLTRTKLPNLELDLSGFKEYIGLNSTDLSQILPNIKFPKTLYEMDLYGATLPANDVDLSFVTGKLNLREANMTACKSIKMPISIKEVNMIDTKLSAIDLDLSGVTEELTISRMYYNNLKSIKIPKKAKRVELSFGEIAGVDLDLSGVENLTLSAIDLTKVKSLRLPANKKSTLMLEPVMLPDASKISYGPKPEDPQTTIAKGFNAATLKLKSDMQTEISPVTPVVLPDQGKGIE